MDEDLMDEDLEPDAPTLCHCGEDDTLDDDGNCPACAAEARSEREHAAGLRRWYQAVAV